MGLWRSIVNWFRPAKKPQLRRRGLSATYDAAGSGEDNRRHWLNTDALSAESANSLSVRKTLRERARYEDMNNGYCRGLCLTLSNDMVGTGPTLQMATDNTEANKQIEAAFHEWAEAIGLAEKLHTAKQSKTRCGESFALLTTDEDLPTSVKLDLQLVETDRVTDPNWEITHDPSVRDGIQYNSAGKPIWYYILDDHPGDTLSSVRTFKKVESRAVLHWFRVDRPGQLRGVPEITPALPLFAQLRRFTLATIVAAEVAAEFAVLLKSTASPDADTTEPSPFSTLDLERGMMTELPAGFDAAQMKAEHPATTYDMFKRELLKEIGRPVNAPFNVTSGDSSPYNYSSARLDHLLYRAAVNVEREHCRRNVLERIFRAWLEEAVMVPGLLPAGTNITQLPHTWYWPGFATIDPLKESQADTEALGNFTTTLSELLGERNRDWEDTLRQAAREQELMDELGLVRADAAPPVAEPQDKEEAMAA